MLKRSPAVNAPFKPLKISKTSNNVVAQEAKDVSIPEIEPRGLSSESKVDNVAFPIGDEVQTFNVLYRKFTTKKNKTWEGDGYLYFKDGIGSLKMVRGKNLGKKSLSEINIGQTISMSGYEVYIDSIADKQERAAGSQLGSPVISEVCIKKQVAFKSSLKSVISSIKAQSDSRSPPPSSTEKFTVDPLLAQYLRPHQISGVQFLYECVMGSKDDCVKGALLGDDMGLGKSLTTISLIWTLLRQKTAESNSPVIKKALIVCPVTLVANWKKEFIKWLGKDRIGIYILDSKSKIRDFTSNSVYQVMITGYERIRSMAEELHDAKFDLVVCDEGHRLKTASNMSAQAINSLNIEKKIILTGTPIQNDLGEFYVTADFLNPGILGTYANFKREFELPIMKSRQPGAPEAVIQKGQDQMDLLLQTTKKFVLRRSAEEIVGYLPPKTEVVLFCKPTSQQISLYKRLLQSTDVMTALESLDSSDHLKAITLLKKACNSISLINHQHNNPIASRQSAKLYILDKMLRTLLSDTDEKVVIVSGYTQTLDIIQQLITSISGNPHFLRLDGSTPQKRRQNMVDEFNRTSSTECFAFLLSAKSGGTGLNLIGASRLILFDADWNPATDLQAMARIHRDGQTRPVFIYRLLTTGCIDEKIFQRQITKQGLAERLMNDQTSDEMQPENTNSVSTSDTFTETELRDLFTLQVATDCNTHDLLDCRCDSSTDYNAVEVDQTSDNESNGDSNDNDLESCVTTQNLTVSEVSVQRKSKAKERLKGLFEYKHIHPTHTDDLQTDQILFKVVEPKIISMIFRRTMNVTGIDEPQNQGQPITGEIDHD